MKASRARVDQDLLMSDKVRLKQKCSSALLALEVPIAMMNVPLVKQVTFLASEFRRTLRTSKRQKPYAM